MKWEQVLKKMNEIETREGSVLDPLEVLAVKVTQRGGHIARVTMQCRRAVQFSEIACSATVSIECPQTEAYLDLAAEVAFAKAKEYADDGFSHLVTEIPQ